MPNYCEGDLIISGPADEVEKFKKFAANKDTPIDQDKFIPYPEHFAKADKAREEYFKLAEEGKNLFKDAPEDGYSNGGYQWCIDNWGTKWGIFDCEIVEEYEYSGEKEIKYTFQTAWSPCNPIIKKMGEIFPELTFTYTYFEAGMAFNGIYRMKKGEVIDDKTGEYFGSRGG